MERTILLSTLIVTVSCMHAQRMLTLEECRDLTIQNSKELQISGEKIKVADSEKKAAFTKYFPQSSANGAYVWNQKDINLLDMGAPFSPLSLSLGGLAQLPMTQHLMNGAGDMQYLGVQNIWVGSVSLVQPVFMGGKIANYSQITKFARQLAESMSNLQLQNLVYKIDETYWQIVSLVNRKKLAGIYVNLLRKVDSDVTVMIYEGIATEADGLSVKVKLNEAEMARTRVENGLVPTRMLLAQIRGLSLEEDLSPADEKLDNFPVEVAQTSAGLNEAFMDHNELKSLDLATKTYKREEHIALVEVLPSVALAADYSVMNPDVFNGFRNDFAGMLNVEVMVEVPLSGWWEDTYRRNSMKAEMHIKTLEWQDAHEKIELQVNQSVYKVNETGRKLIASSRSMENAEENLRRANFGSKEGVIPALNLMETRTVWVSTRSSLIDVQIEMKLTEAYLSKVLDELPADE